MQHVSSDVRGIVIIAAVVLGLAVGSFLNVVIWRVPRGENVAHPPSHCPNCDTQLSALDNVPLLSWLVLRGKCRTCKVPISVRYPLVEALTGLLWGLVAWRFSGTHAGLAYLPSAIWLTGLGVALAAIDLDTHRLPNVLTLPAYPIGAALLIAATPAAHSGADPLFRAAMWGAGGWLFFYALHAGTGGRGMGYGDVKLSGVLGMHLGFLGWKIALIGFFASFFIGGVVGIGLILFTEAGRKTKVPFGPYLIAGALLALLRGSEIAHVWLGSS